MTLAREAHRRARALLAANRECLDDLAANALERETLTREDLDEIFAAHELREPDALGHARARRGHAFLGGRRARVASSAPWRTATGTPTYYFPPGRSMARRVHGERSVGLLYGQRALLIGALEPLTYTGTMLSTRSADRPFQRLARTAKIQETVLLGTREEADKALAVVQRLHERVKGTLPEAAGVHPAGTAYSAFDPELMLWTLAVIADSGRAMYETMVRPLTRRRARGPLAGLRALRRALRPAAQRGPRQLPRVQRLVGGAALPRPTCRRPRTGWRWRRWSPSEQPVPAPARGNLVAQNHIIKGTLPPRVREIFGIRWSRAHEAGFRAMTAGPPPRPPPLPAQRCAAAATTSSSTWSPRPSASAAAPGRPSSPASAPESLARRPADERAGALVVDAPRRRTASRPPTAAPSAASTCPRSASTS